jgi:hypothetical protein
MSMPRCPEPNGESGGSNARITGPETGQLQIPAALAGVTTTQIADATTRMETR